jgi:hypothetical protein
MCLHLSNGSSFNPLQDTYTDIFFFDYLPISPNHVLIKLLIIQPIKKGCINS